MKFAAHIWRLVRDPEVEYARWHTLHPALTAPVVWQPAEYREF